MSDAHGYLADELDIALEVIEKLLDALDEVGELHTTAAAAYYAGEAFLRKHPRPTE